MKLFVLVMFFFKQKTAYEMRISDWSSDVCSSDLLDADGIDLVEQVAAPDLHRPAIVGILDAQSGIGQPISLLLAIDGQRIEEVGPAAIALVHECRNVEVRRDRGFIVEAGLPRPFRRAGSLSGPVEDAGTIFDRCRRRS